MQGKRDKGTIQTIKKRLRCTPMKSTPWQLLKVLHFGKSGGGHNSSGNAEVSLQLARHIYAVGPSHKESTQAERRRQMYGNTDTVTLFTCSDFSSSQHYLQPI